MLKWTIFAGASCMIDCVIGEWQPDLHQCLYFLVTCKTVLWLLGEKDGPLVEMHIEIPQESFQHALEKCWVSQQVPSRSENVLYVQNMGTLSDDVPLDAVCWCSQPSFQRQDFSKYQILFFLLDQKAKDIASSSSMIAVS